MAKGKAKKAVTLAPSPWDHGADGRANRAGLVVEERGEVDPKTGNRRNPNRVDGVRRQDMLELYWRRGKISQRGYAAGEAMRVAWLRTELGQAAPWLRDRVDSSPKPDHAIAIQIERISGLLKFSRMVAADDARIIHTVVALGCGVHHLREYRSERHALGIEHLRAALDRLADRMEGL